MKAPEGLMRLVLGFDCSELGLKSKTNSYMQNIPGLKLPLINLGLFALDHRS